MSIKLVTDGSVDIPPSIVEQYDIPVVPPLVIIDGKELLSGVEITLEEFFQRQRTAAALPKTSQPAPGQFLEVFEQALASHDQVLYIGLSSGLSGTFNSAKQAAGELPDGKVVLHDTKSISGGAGLQVIAAARSLAAGGTMEAALNAARQTQRSTEFYLAVEELTFLIKGGRVSKLSGAIGSMFDIKPIITVDKSEGTLVPHSRIRSFKAAIKKVIDLADSVVGQGKAGRFMILHGEMPDEAQALLETIRSRYDARWSHAMPSTPTLGAHTGPRTIALAVAPGDWP